MLRTTPTLAALAAALLLAGCGDGAREASADAHGHAEGAGEADHDSEKGPQGGRLLRSGDFALELLIYEAGASPEFHAYAYRKGKPVSPEAVKVEVELTRLDGEVDRVAFAPQGDFLRGLGAVEEPHSFDVKVRASEGGRSHRWTYGAYEGRTTLTPEAAAAGGATVRRSGDLHQAADGCQRSRRAGRGHHGRGEGQRPLRRHRRGAGDRHRAGDRIETLLERGDARIKPVAIAVQRIDRRRQTSRLVLTFLGGPLHVLRLPGQFGESGALPPQAARLLAGEDRNHQRGNRGGRPGPDTPHQAAVELVLFGQETRNPARGTVVRKTRVELFTVLRHPVSAVPSDSPANHG